MDNNSTSGGGCKTLPDEWADAQEVLPKELGPRRCAACFDIFIPKWYKAKRCEWCRKNNIPYANSNNQDKPF